MCSSNKAWDNVYSSGWGIIKQIWGVTLLPQIRICPRCASHIMLWQSPSSSAWRTRPPQRASPAVFQTSHSPSFCHALARVVPLPGVYFSFFMLLTPTGSSDRAKSVSSSRLSPSSFLSDSHPNSIRRPSFVLSLTIPRFLPSSFGQPAYEWDPLSALSQQARGISGYKIADSHPSLYSQLVAQGLEWRRYLTNGRGIDEQMNEDESNKCLIFTIDYYQFRHVLS